MDLINRMLDTLANLYPAFDARLEHIEIVTDEIAEARQASAQQPKTPRSVRQKRKKPLREVD